jgi:hypothetical protein
MPELTFEEQSAQIQPMFEAWAGEREWWKVIIDIITEGNNDDSGGSHDIEVPSRILHWPALFEAVYRECDTCHGSGEGWAEPDYNCDGTGYVARSWVDFNARLIPVVEATGGYIEITKSAVSIMLGRADRGGKYADASRGGQHPIYATLEALAQVMGGKA